MAVNIGPKIGIDGEKEYRKQINELITQQKTFSAEMKELESSFDDSTSAMEKSRKKGELLEKQIKNQEKQVEELEKGLDAAADKYGENATETQKWKQAVSNAKTELNKMKKELNTLPKSLKNVGQSMQDVGKKMQSVGSGMTKYITAPLTAIGAASIAAWNEVDEGMDIVVKKTGATGDALESLQTSMTNIATTIPTSFETAGDAIGSVNTRFGLTGTALEELSGKFIKFADLNNTDVSSSVEKTQKIMAAFGLETEDAGTLLDAMNKTGQKTGVSMDTLQTSMIKNAAALNDMGLNAYDAANFLGQVETSGADSATVMAGLSKALINANKEGKTLPEALSEFQGIMSSTASEQEKLNAAVELFGSKAGKEIYNACKQGSLSFESLSTDASEYLGSVEETFENVLDPADQFAITMNKMKEAGSQIGGTLLEIAAPAVEAVGEAAGKASEWFQGLTENQQKTAAGIAIAFAASGPALVALGNLIEAGGKVTSAVGGALTKLEAVPGVAAALSSPVALGALAVGAMAVAFNTMDQDAGFANETVQNLVDNTKTAISNLDDATTSLSDSLSESEAALKDINGKADLAEDLINELAALEKQSELTSEQQGRMRTIVGELNSLYPDLGVSIDESTGKLSKSTAEMKKYVEGARKMALLEAYTKAAKGGYEKLAEAQIALNDARAQATENLTTLNSLEAEKNRLDSMSADEQKAIGTQAYADALAEAENNIVACQTRQDNLNAAVDTAQETYNAAEQSISAYEAEAEKLADEINNTTEAQNENTEATKAAVKADEEAAKASKDTAKAFVKKVNGFAKGVSDLITNTKKEVDAYNESYQSAYDSIKGQIGLFDEWQQNTEVTAQKILENLQSQVEGMSKYNENMETLTKAAVESNDPNFKAFVQALAEMGLGAAGEVQALVDALEQGGADQDSILSQIVASYGKLDGVEKKVAQTNATISNNFQGLPQITQKAFTTVGAKVKSGMETFGKYIVDTAKKSKDETEKATQETVTNTETSINGMHLEPKVAKISVPEVVKTNAKSEVKSAITNVPGSVGALQGAAQAGKNAAKTASSNMKVTGTVSISGASDAAEKARNAIQNFFNNNPIISWIKTKTSGSPDRNALGGIIQNETLSWLAEGNNAEAVIPLEAHRSRALSLYEETGRILGVDNIQTSTTVTFPGGQSTSATGNIKVGFDEERLFETVAAAAAAGLENANVRIYWDSREAGRIMKDMGVQFA